MSSAEATVDETVLTTTTVHAGDATRAATVLALLALTQLAHGLAGWCTARSGC